MTDKTHLNAGKYYDKLPNSLIVFISLQDPFSAELPKYTFHHKCEETDITLNDGATAMFLNASSEMNCEEGLRQFLAYLRGKKPTTELTEKIDTAVRKAIDDQSGKERYMTLLERDRENTENGIKIGKQEGAIEMLVSLVKDGTITMKQGIEKSGLSEEEFLKVLNA